ncbi:hypothetical protein HK096_001192 [Nowakowskiella sp. JEL0078]|nr:hypothetical protein HK096_001192 [Nowakowskiella sp. JEL0078]
MLHSLAQTLSRHTSRSRNTSENSTNKFDEEWFTHFTSNATNIIPAPTFQNIPKIRNQRVAPPSPTRRSLSPTRLSTDYVSQVFQLEIHAVSGILPSDASITTGHIRVTLFDSQNSVFFGKTWESPKIDFKLKNEPGIREVDDHFTDSDISTNNENGDLEESSSESNSNTFESDDGGSLGDSEKKSLLYEKEKCIHRTTSYGSLSTEGGNETDNENQNIEKGNNDDDSFIEKETKTENISEESSNDPRSILTADPTCQIKIVGSKISINFKNQVTQF